jgi:UDPglucose--hexose-1-phosphate uridylyltransferase
MDKKSEVRKDYFEEKYVVFAPKRNARPHQIVERQKIDEHCKECFFCPGNETATVVETYKEGTDNQVKVIENIFPAFTLDNDKAYGKQEVVIETPKHGEAFSDLPLDHIKTILEAYADRINKLNLIPGINHVQIFKNSGAKAGASIEHSHSQIFAMQFIPEQIQNTALAMDEYYYRNKNCPYCDIAIKESKEKIRVIYEDENIIAYCPYASTSAYAASILPKNHKRTLKDLDQNELNSLAKGLKIITQKLDSVDIAYNFLVLDSLPHNDHHFRVEIITRINVWGGFEFGSGIIINPIFPEDAALFYKE